MKSRITIEVDFENNNQPVLQIIFRKSDDVRDNLLNSFLQNMGGMSNWCHVKQRSHYEGINPEDTHSKYILTMIKPEDLKEQHRQMAENIEWMGNVAKED